MNILIKRRIEEAFGVSHAKIKIDPDRIDAIVKQYHALSNDEQLTLQDSEENKWFEIFKKVSESKKILSENLKKKDYFQLKNLCQEFKSAKNGSPEYNYMLMIESELLCRNTHAKQII